jgi:hybrid cluster-associated redox disulfide protein
MPKSKTTLVAIRADMPVVEVLTLLPESKSILAEYGLHCFDCEFGARETLAQGCQSHGMTDDDIGDLVEDLNTLLQEQPARPQTLIITEAAAKALADIALQEQRQDEGLSVSIDTHGGFCLEFRTDALPDEKTFTQPAVPGLRVFASAITLQRIGGATIDFREARFKLDLPEDSGKCCQGTRKDCGCSSGTKKSPCGCKSDAR